MHSLSAAGGHRLYSIFLGTSWSITGCLRQTLSGLTWDKSVSPASLSFNLGSGWYLSITEIWRDFRIRKIYLSVQGTLHVKPYVVWAWHRTNGYLYDGTDLQASSSFPENRVGTGFMWEAQPQDQLWNYKTIRYITYCSGIRRLLGSLCCKGIVLCSQPQPPPVEQSIKGIAAPHSIVKQVK